MDKIRQKEQTEWRNTIASKPKLRTFVKFKLVYQTELYVSSLLPKSKRSLLSQFRCGVLPLATETGRYRQIPSNERYCTFCDENAIEDLRDVLFHNINSIEPTVVNISAMSGIDLLTFLMNDKFVKCVADFISNAWYKRQHALFN